MHSNTSLRGGAVTLALAMLTATASLALALVQDWFVDVNHPACGTGDGTQASPFCDIMDAVAAAASGDTIHIAPGTYFENVVLDKDLHLVGTGGEAVTILDGTASGSVVTVGPQPPSWLPPTVTLSGLRLTNGAASAGGGLYVGAKATLTNCTVAGNVATDSYGGGICVGSRGHATLTNCTVTGNVATGPSNGYSYGGGICVLRYWGLAGTLVLENSSVTGNSAMYGGGIYGGPGLRSGLVQITITNSLVSGNYAVLEPGIASHCLTITNSTVSNNSASSGSHWARAGIVAFYDLRLENSVVWGNAGGAIAGGVTHSVTHSLIEGGWAGTGNLDADPLFVDPLNGDYRLLPGSPCIDAGDNTAVPPGLTTDLRGAPRFLDDPWTPDTGMGAAPVVDMGAFEFFRRDARGVPVIPAPPRRVP